MNDRSSATSSAQRAATPVEQGRGTLCLTFDNMGQARRIADDVTGKPDPDEIGLKIGYPRVLDLLDDLALKATFFIEGWNALHHPGNVAELAERGHEVGLHGWVHEKFAALSFARAEQVMYDGFAALDRLQIRPVGFRAPGGVRGPHAVRILSDLQLVVDSSIEHGLTDAVEATDFLGSTEPSLLAHDLVNIPWRWSMVDAAQYFYMPGGPRSPELVCSIWRSMVDKVALNGATMTLDIHPYISGTDDARFQVLVDVLEAAIQSGLNIVTAGALAAQVLQNSPGGRLASSRM